MPKLLETTDTDETGEWVTIPAGAWKLIGQFAGGAEWAGNVVFRERRVGDATEGTILADGNGTQVELTGFKGNLIYESTGQQLQANFTGGDGGVAFIVVAE